METKTFCANCRVHCYKPAMREKIRAVMRFSGPRMIFHHPVAAIWHVIETKREKKRLEKTSLDKSISTGVTSACLVHRPAMACAFADFLSPTTIFHICAHAAGNGHADPCRRQ